MTEHAFMTTSEVAELLRVPPETVRYWRSRGDRGPKSWKIPGGKRVLYSRAEVERWLTAAMSAGNGAA